jgi:hypothetical protein
MEEDKMGMLNRLDLANRWKTSIRTIDRKRKFGLLPWIDLSGGAGKRPIVRFRLEDIEEYEGRAMQKAACR